jgi:hypothetical protein
MIIGPPPNVSNLKGVYLENLAMELEREELEHLKMDSVFLYDTKSYLEQDRNGNK